MIYPDYSILLKKARENRGLTQKELSDRLSFSSQTLSLWEIGKSAMKINVMFDVCNILKIDPVEFENGEIVARKQERSIDLNKLLRYIKAKISERKILVDVVQFFLMSVALNFSIEEALVSSSSKDILEPLKARRGILPLSIAAIAILSIGITSIVYHVFRKESADIAMNQLPKEATPVLKINYIDKTLEGFEAYQPYLIEEEDITPISTSIGIKEDWIDKTIKIKKKARNESYLDSEEFTITIESDKLQ